MNRVLIQNLKDMSIWEGQKVNIDHVLSSDCEEIELTDSTLTREDFKIFVKLWMRGSNKKLINFSARRRIIPTQENPPFDENVFFKRIKYTKIPLDSEEVFKMEYEHSSYEIKLAGGFRIRRFDGTNTVVMIYERIFQLDVV